MRIVSNKFKQQLSVDVLENCCLHGLYECIEKHDSTLGSKFTTSLYYHISLQCMRTIYKQANHRINELVDVGFSHNTAEALIIEEFLDVLNDREKSMVRDRYLNSLTFSELATKYDCTAPGAKYIINKAIDRMNLEYNKGENQDL